MTGILSTLKNPTRKARAAVCAALFLATPAAALVATSTPASAATASRWACSLAEVGTTSFPVHDNWIKACIQTVWTNNSRSVRVSVAAQKGWCGARLVLKNLTVGSRAWDTGSFCVPSGGLSITGQETGTGWRGFTWTNQPNMTLNVTRLVGYVSGYRPSGMAGYFTKYTPVVTYGAW